MRVQRLAGLPLSVTLRPNTVLEKVVTRKHPADYDSMPIGTVQMLVEREPLLVDVYAVGPSLAQLEDRSWHKNYLNDVSYLERTPDGVIVVGEARVFKEQQVVVWRSHGVLVVACRYVDRQVGGSVDAAVRKRVSKACRELTLLGPPAVDKVNGVRWLDYQSLKHQVRFRFPEGALIDEKPATLVIRFPGGSKVIITPDLHVPGCFQQVAYLSPARYGPMLVAVCRSLSRLVKGIDAPPQQPHPIKTVPLEPALLKQAQTFSTQLMTSSVSERAEVQTRLNEWIAQTVQPEAQLLALTRTDFPRVVAATLHYWAQRKSSVDAFLAPLIGALAHPRDRVRYTAAVLLRYLPDRATRRATMPYLRYLLHDKSGIVRAEVLDLFLVERKRKPEELALAFVSDPAPQVQGLVARFAGSAQLKSLAQKVAGLTHHDDPYVRCKSLLALAELNRFVAVDMKGMETLLSSQQRADYRAYFDDGGGVLYAGPETLMDCALKAFPGIAGKRFSGEPEEILRKWLEYVLKLSGKALKKEDKVCLGSKQCEDGALCQNVLCRPFATVESTYWRLQNALVCLTRRKLEKSRHMLERQALFRRYGFRIKTDRRAYQKLVKFLQKKGPLYQAEFDKLKLSKCP